MSKNISQKKVCVVFGGGGLLGRNLIRLLSNEYMFIVVDVNTKEKFDTSDNQLYNGNIFDKKVTRLIRDHKPSLIVNSVNLATVCTANDNTDFSKLVNLFHEIYTNLNEIDEKCTYVQIGTTGSGGLGFDIPFTHGQPKRNLPIINKAAMSGVITAMNILLSRSLPQNIKIVEVKPGLSIFSQDVLSQEVDGLKINILDGGESGSYTYDEVALLTTYMGFTTVNNVCKIIDDEIRGKNNKLSYMASNNITEAINNSIISEARSDKKKKKALLKRLHERNTDDYLIATGNLGPPDITLDLLRAKALTLQAVNNKKIPSDLDIIKKNLNYLKETKTDLFEYINKRIDIPLSNHNAFRKMKEPHQIVQKILKARIDLN